MSFVSEALVISGVALDLVGATVLSHAHNAESALELREEIGGMSAHLARRMPSLPTRSYSRRNVLAFSSWLSASRCT
jgi:hypothetical protein